MGLNVIITGLTVSAASVATSIAAAGIAYPPIVALSGSQHSYAFVGVHGTTDDDDNFTWDVSASGSPATGDTAVVDGTYGVATISALTPVGIGVFASLNAGSTPELSFQQSFQCSTDFVMNWNATFMSGGFLRLAKFDDANAVGGGNQIGTTIDFASNAGPISLSATVGNEYYKLFYANYGSGPVAASYLTQVTFNTVPAPGAFALLGAAGLAGRRRRR